MTVVAERQPEQRSGKPGAGISLRGLSVRLGERLALEDVTCDIPPGAFVGLIGPNGSGKSTLLRAVLGILPWAAGSVLIDGRSPDEARDLFAYLPQRQQLELDLPLRARDVVMMGRLRRSSWLLPPSRADREIVAQALESVGLSDRARSPISEMSFGQQQRVLFARALVQEGSVLLLDEPMNGVDPRTQELFLEQLAGLHARGVTIVMATHDLNQASSACDSLLVLNRRLVAFGPVPETLTEEVLSTAYGVHLHLDAGRAAASHLLEDRHHHETDSQRSAGDRLA